MSKRTFEREIPDGYRLVKHINANAKLVGIILNVASLVIAMAVAFVSMSIFHHTVSSVNALYALLGAGASTLFSIIYMVLHELTHGIAYKIATREKLKFGMSWSCAFCGVPNIYVYRKYTLIAVLLPVLLFTVLLVPIMAVCAALADGAYSKLVTFIYYASSFVLGINIGGSSGDLFLAFLLFFKYRRRDTLIRDTGPEQYIYERDTI